jgi:uncharacterized Fe-S cluster protein YjdI/CDGSH-type Zn-finger protein
MMNWSDTVDQPARTYENDEIAVAWYPERCIHSARCVAGLPDVFDPGRKPWVVLEGHSADEIAAVVQRCPTGALHFRRNDGGAAEPVPGETTIVVVPDGPLFVRGDVTVADENGTVIGKDTRMALCRCGQSANKPFCDNTHRRIGFRTRAPATEPDRAARGNGGATDA